MAWMGMLGAPGCFRNDLDSHIDTNVSSISFRLLLWLLPPFARMLFALLVHLRSAKRRRTVGFVQEHNHHLRLRS